MTARWSGRDRHARPVSWGSVSRRDCSSAESIGRVDSDRGRAIRRDTGDGEHPGGEEFGNRRQQQRVVRAVPVPDAVVEAENRAREHPGVALRDRALPHRVLEESSPGDLERARLIATDHTRLLFALRAALFAQQGLFGNEDAVAQDLVLGEGEAVVAHRPKRQSRIRLACGDRVETLVQLAQGIAKDHVQAVLLGVEVVVQSCSPDAYVIGDVGPLRVLVPVAPESIDGRGEDLSSPGSFIVGATRCPRALTICGLIRTHVSQNRITRQGYATVRIVTCLWHDAPTLAGADALLT